VSRISPVVSSSIEEKSRDSAYLPNPPTSFSSQSKSTHTPTQNSKPQSVSSNNYTRFRYFPNDDPLVASTTSNASEANCHEQSPESLDNDRKIRVSG